MKINLFSLLFCFLSLCSSVSGQGIRTWYTDYDSAVRAAKREQKNIFIDTYTKWCIPCKRMNRVFADREVGKVINEHYITLKVNMETPEGEKIKSMFQVVFLPTLIILNAEEEVLYKVDREMSASELVDKATLALNPNVYISSDATALVGQRKAKTTVAPKPVVVTPPKRTTTLPKSQPRSTNDKIVHVLGEEKDGVDQQAFTRQEAYFRLELMDGSHTRAAEQYLSTQDDWNTKENMQFILDFVNAPNTPLYNHITNNRDAYDETFSADQVNSTLMILIYKHLYKGIPRPTMSEAVQLYKDLRFDQPEDHARKYFITRTKLDEDYQTTYDLSYEYLNQHNKSDEKALAKFIIFVHDKNEFFSKEQLVKAAQLAEKYKLSVEHKVTVYPLALKMYEMHNECKKAKKVLKKLTSLAKSYKFEMPTLTPQCDA